MRIIAEQFAMKNTMGYSLNAFVDHDRPVDILTHLVVGSEGTLAFVAEAVFRTVALLPHAATGLLVFDDLAAATGVLPEIAGTGAATIELMDAASLRVGQSDPKAVSTLRAIDVRTHAALLVEYQAESAEELRELSGSAGAVLNQLQVSGPATLTSNAAARAGLWHVRKGLYASVAGARPSGTTALLEDIVVPVDALERTCSSLTRLFDQHGYGDSVIFGHAKDGNVHFMLTDRFDQEEPQERYHRFTEDMVDLVLGNGGSLKAEHGTGRMMSPYVRRQYGDELYDVMRELKATIDPGGMLNPGVILDDDPRAHLRHIKTALAVEPEVDRCVECGYCEPVCPSRDLTTTPRQRIVLRRAMENARLAGDTALLAELQRDYDYEAVQTCAADGMCQTACPVSINTGDLVKRLRRADAGRIESRAWTSAAKHWSTATRGAAAALTTAAALPDPLVCGASGVGRKVLGSGKVPLWSPELPRGGSRRSRPAPEIGNGPGEEAGPGQEPGPRTGAAAGAVAAVYLPSCVNAMFGPAAGGPGVQRGFEELCRRVGIEVLVLPGADSLCCGTPWSSKGMADGGAVMGSQVAQALTAAVAGRDVPVVCDASSCTEGIHQLVAATGLDLQVIDVIQFVTSHVLPKLPAGRKLPSVVVHPTCSSTRLGIDSALMEIAGAVADEVHRPVSWGCCAFAGDRGLLHPELTESATRTQACEVAAFDGTAHASCNRTCELGMTRATGKPYRHILELLAEVTREDDD